MQRTAKDKKVQHRFTAESATSQSVSDGCEQCNKPQDDSFCGSTHQGRPHGEEVREKSREARGEAVLGEDRETQLRDADYAVPVIPVPAPARDVEQVPLSRETTCLS